MATNFPFKATTLPPAPVEVVKPPPEKEDDSLLTGGLDDSTMGRLTPEPPPDLSNFKLRQLSEQKVDDVFRNFGSEAPYIIFENTVVDLRKKYGSENITEGSVLDGTAPLLNALPKEILSRVYTPEQVENFQFLTPDEKSLSTRQVINLFTNTEDVGFFQRLAIKSPEAAGAVVGFTQGAKLGAVGSRYLASRGMAAPAFATALISPFVGSLLGEDVGRLSKEVFGLKGPTYNPFDRTAVKTADTAAFGLGFASLPAFLRKGLKGKNPELGGALLMSNVARLKGTAGPGLSAFMVKGLEDLVGAYGRKGKIVPEVGFAGLSTAGRAFAEQNFPGSDFAAITGEVVAPVGGAVVTKALSPFSPLRILSGTFNKIAQNIGPVEPPPEGAGFVGRQISKVKNYGSAITRVFSERQERAAVKTYLQRARDAGMSEKQLEQIAKEFEQGNLKAIFKDPILSDIRERVQDVYGLNDPLMQKLSKEEQRIFKEDMDKVFNTLATAIKDDTERGYALASAFAQDVIETQMASTIQDRVIKLQQAYQRIKDVRANQGDFTGRLVDRLVELDAIFSKEAEKLYKKVPDHTLFFDADNPFPLSNFIRDNNIELDKLNLIGSPKLKDAIEDISILSKQQDQIDAAVAQGNTDVDPIQLPYLRVKGLLTRLNDVITNRNLDAGDRGIAKRLKSEIDSLILYSDDVVRGFTRPGDTDESFKQARGNASTYYRAYKSVFTGENGILSQITPFDIQGRKAPHDILLDGLKFTASDRTARNILDLQRVENFGVNPLDTKIPTSARDDSFTLRESAPTLEGQLDLKSVVLGPGSQSVDNLITAHLLSSGIGSFDSQLDTPLTLLNGRKFDPGGVLVMKPDNLLKYIEQNTTIGDGPKRKLFDLFPEVAQELSEIARRSKDLNEDVELFNLDLEKFRKQNIWTAFTVDPDQSSFLDILTKGFAGVKNFKRDLIWDNFMIPIRKIEDAAKNPRELLTDLQNKGLADTYLNNRPLSDLSDEEVTKIAGEVVGDAKTGLRELIFDYARDNAGLDVAKFEDILFSKAVKQKGVSRPESNPGLANWMKNNDLISEEEVSRLRTGLEQAKREYSASKDILRQRETLGEQIKGGVAGAAGAIAGSALLNRFIKFAETLGIGSGAVGAGPALSVPATTGKIARKLAKDAEVGSRITGFYKLLQNPAKFATLLREMKSFEAGKPVSENAKEIIQEYLVTVGLIVPIRRSAVGSQRVITEEIDVLPSDVEKDEKENDEVSSVDDTPVPVAAVQRPPTVVAAPPPIPRQVAAVQPPRPPLAGGPIDPARAAFAFGPQDMLARPALAAKGGAVNGGGIGTFFKERGR